MHNKLFILFALCAVMMACQQEPDFALDHTTLSLKVGDMQTISVIGNATDVEWTSSNDSVATVFHGVVTAKAIGASTIVARSGKTEVNCHVFVSGTDGATLRITPTLVSLKKGDTFRFQYGNAYELPLSWTSSDESVVTVSGDGLVTALKSGNAIITLKTNLEEVAAVVAVEHKWGNYQLVWSDEFNGISLDESIWNYDTGGGGWGNQELQYYTKCPENIRVQNGCLEIEALKEKYETREYTSARIHSKDKKTFVYGKIESRIKFPGGKGTWPAFWMLGNQGVWPKCGEIDIIEHIGAQPSRASFALHTDLKNGMRGNNWASTHFFDTSLADDFHIYGIEWCQEEEGGKDCMRFFVDNVEYATVWENDIDNAKAWPFNRPFYIIFNLAIGGNMGGTVDDAIFNEKRIMYVDWVRVYQREEIE